MMKALNNKYKGTTWRTGNFPKAIVFDDLTNEHIQFIEKLGLNHLIIEVCDVCLKEKCKCKKVKKQDEAEQE